MQPAASHRDTADSRCPFLEEVFACAFSGTVVGGRGRDVGRGGGGGWCGRDVTMVCFSIPLHGCT